MIETLPAVNLETEFITLVPVLALQPEQSKELDISKANTKEEMRQLLHQARLKVRLKELSQSEITLLEEKLAQNVYFLAHGGFRDIPDGLEILIQSLNYVGITTPVRNKYILKWLTSTVAKDKRIAKAEFDYALDSMRKSLTLIEDDKETASEAKVLRDEILSREINQLSDNFFILADGNGQALTHFFTLLQNFDIKISSAALYEKLLEQHDQLGNFSNEQFKELVLNKLDLAKKLLKTDNLRTDAITRLRTYFDEHYTLSPNRVSQ